MKNLIFIFFLLAANFSIVFSQEDKDSLKLNLHNSYQISDYLSEEINGNEMSILNFDMPLTADTNSIWLWTSAALSNYNKAGFKFGESSPHMFSNLHQTYIENSKFSIIKTILGAAQLGAVGFLAYKHVKKYGFFK